MFERTNQPSPRRGDDDMLRRMLFGTNGSRRQMSAPQDRPVMEQVSPQSAGVGTNGNTDDAPFSACIDACSLAMVYAPVQEWQDLFPIERALCEGTLFRELAKPFKGKTLLGR